MLHRAKDMSPADKSALEHLLGRSLTDDESVSIRAVKSLKDAPFGNERQQAFNAYLSSAAQMGARAAEKSSAELGSAMEEALYQVRHYPQ